MGTHPIFESDFDCLTGFRMNFIKDDDKFLLHPKIDYVKSGRITRQFIDWNSKTDEGEDFDPLEEYYDCEEGGYDSYEEEEEECGFSFEKQEDGKYFYIHPVPAELISVLIGRQHSTLKRIEQTSKCKLVLPKRGLDDVRIVGSKVTDVDRCKTLVELTLEGKRWTKTPNYFLSFSLAVPS